MILSQLRPIYLIVAVEHYYSVFKGLLDNAATVNIGIISPLLPALCIVHSSPGFCPKAPVLHLTLPCTWLASAGRGSGHSTGVTHWGARGGTGGRWMVESWAVWGQPCGEQLSFSRDSEEEWASMSSVMRGLLFFFFFFRFLKKIIFIFGCVGSLLLHAGFSLVVVSRGYSVAVHGLLIVAASLVAEHRL